MGYVAIENPMFQKAMRVITNITSAFPATVTTSFDHNYITGQIVTFVMPLGYGIPQLNKVTTEITVTGDDTFTIPIDTTTMFAFSLASPQKQYPQVLPTGEINSILSAATQNVLPF